MHIFVTLSQQQKEKYRRIQDDYEHVRQNAKLGSQQFTADRSTMTDLMRVCNHLQLLPSDNTATEMHTEDQKLDGICATMYVLEKLLRELNKGGDHRKVVVVSNYTKLLDLISRMFVNNIWPTQQLDGKTSQTERQACVLMMPAITDPLFFCCRPWLADAD
jgi:SNF2 family DNA or RNA helicase